jgi:mRNA-degrading endonuclease RelE of RelBE toxin-antitoxin system
MARIETRHRVASSKKTRQQLAKLAEDTKREITEIAERERRYHAASLAYAPKRQRLDELRRIHAGNVGVIAQRAGIKIGHPNAVPDGLDVPMHRVLVDEIHALYPWSPPPDACVRGATEDDPREVIRVLIALERHKTLRAACQLAFAATPPLDRSRRGLTSAECLRKRVLRCGAYNRWRTALKHHVEVTAQVSVYGDTAEKRAERLTSLRALLALHS